MKTIRTLIQPARTTALERSSVGSERKETQDERRASAERRALVAELELLNAEQARPARLREELRRLDAQAEAERAQRAKAAAIARMDELVRADRAELVERRMLYLALAANKARHTLRWDEAEGLRHSSAIPNRVHGFDFAGDPQRLVEAIDTLLSAP